MADIPVRDKPATARPAAPVAKSSGPIGARIERKEDARFLTGAGQYTDDITLPHQSYACFVRSTHAHARLRSVQTEAARRSPGVLAVYTAADLPPAVCKEARRTLLNSTYLLIAIVGLWAGSVYVPASVTQLATAAGFAGGSTARLASYGTMLLSAGIAELRGGDDAPSFFQRADEALYRAKESGKGRSVHFRWAVNTRARQALSTFVDNSRQSSAWAANLYTAARARGKRHPHAIRILMRAWVRAMWALIQAVWPE